jgi:hypothetical protein
MVRKAYDSQRTKEDTLIPSHPFTCVLCGAIASGKSNLLLHLLLHKDNYFQKFNRIILFSPTLEMDEKMEKLMQCNFLCRSNQALSDAIWREECQCSIQLNEELPERPILPPFKGIEAEDIYTEYDPQILQDLIDHQKEIIKSYGKDLSDRCLVIMDDSPTLGVFRQSHRDLFARFVLTIRHYNCSLILCTQMMKTVPKITRHNLTGCMCFECNDKEREDIYEAFGANIPRSRWEELFAVLTSKPYSFFQCNLKNSKGKKIIKDLEEFVA